MSTRLVVAVAVALLGLLGGCASTSPSGFSDQVFNQAGTMAAPLPLVMALRDYPLRQAQRPTTDAAVYVGNLRGRLEALDRRADRDSGALLTMRASTTFELYQIEGRLVLLDRAAALAKAAVTADPGVADAWLIQGHTGVLDPWVQFNRHR